MAKGPFYEEGLHVAEVTSQGFTKASTGTMQFVLGVKILGVPASDSTFTTHRYQNSRTIYMAMTAKTVPFVAEALKRIGFEGKPSQLDPASANHVSLLGRQVDLWCKHEPDQHNELRERWQVSNGGASREFEALPPKEMRELDALFGRALKPAPATRNVHDQEITDDDIPF